MTSEKDKCSYDCEKSLARPPACDRCPENDDFWKDYEEEQIAKDTFRDQR